MSTSESQFLYTYEMFKNSVYSCIYSYLQNADDANELTQEVFIKFLTDNTKFKDDNHKKAWLLRVAINLSKNYLRDNSRINYGYELPDNTPDVKDAYEEKGIFDLVLSLPEKYRIPLHLFYYEDYSVKQIAKVMNSPESTVRVQLKRGREMLKEKIDEEGYLWIQ